MGAIAVLYWLFDFVFEKNNQEKIQNFPGKVRSQLSNAEYHLTAGQMAQIIQTGKNLRDRVLLQMLAETGMRRSEVTGLNIEDVKQNERLLLIRQGKGMKSRLVPMTQMLAENLKKLIVVRTTGPVFQSRNGNRLSLRQINRVVAEAGIQAGVKNPNPKYKNMTPHLFRHSFARLWKKKGGSIETLSKIMGHSSVRTTWDLYGKESLEDIRRNYQRMMRNMTGMTQ